MGPQEIKTAVEDARQGDREAFGKLVRHYQRRVFLCAMRVVLNEEDANDVAQEAFVRAYRAIDRFDGRSEFFTWLYRIVVNVALNHRRANKRKPTVSLDSGASGVLSAALKQQAAGNTQREAELRQAVGDVRHALGELPDSLRATVALVIFDGLSYAETAKVLEVSQGTVAWRVHEARKRLRQILEKHLDGVEVDDR
jgi:RNA polymerase sigma-70 factor, ECF subfamily